MVMVVGGIPDLDTHCDMAGLGRGVGRVGLDAVRLNVDALEDLLREWARVYGEGRAVNAEGWLEDSSLTGANPIARAMEFGSREDKSAQIAYLRPRGRLPWSDPMRAKETRARPAEAVLRRFKGKAEKVEAAVTQMGLLNDCGVLWALVLRAQYCTRGRQVDKVAWLEGRGHTISLRYYRQVLAYAKVWMAGRLTS